MTTTQKAARIGSVRVIRTVDDARVDVFPSATQPAMLHVHYVDHRGRRVAALVELSEQDCASLVEALTDAVEGNYGEPAEMGWMSADGGKWHRATTAEPVCYMTQTAACGMTFQPLNVTWNGDMPPTSSHYMCQRKGCQS